jgi:hypothetical protein
MDEMMMKQLRVMAGGKECCVVDQRVIEQREYDNSRKKN